MFNHRSGEIFQAGDAQIYFESNGPSHGHSLLLLHGGLGNLEDFSKITDLLPESLRVVAVDLRGHGRSTLGSGPITYEQHQRDVQSVAAHLGLTKYSILGFSDGGIVAYRIAAENPGVSALVTIGAQWRISREDPSFEILAGVTPAVWAEMFPDAPGKYTALNPQGDFDKLVESCVGLWTDLSSTGYPNEKISEIACPTLILRGDSDFLLSLTEAAKAQAKIPGASFGNVPFAGHAAMDDAPEITGRIVHDFLANPRRAQAEA